MLKKFITLFLFVLLTILNVVPASAASWKSIRNEEGERITWLTCTVEYAIDGNGHSTKAIRAAIKEAEKVSGLDFRRVKWNQAELQVYFSNKRSKKSHAYTEYTYLGNKQYFAFINVYGGVYKRSYNTQLNVYRHEIGHALGLAHIKGSDVMNKKVGPKHTRTAWKAGLKWLYKKC